jgi:class 3 adenylate cyclase
MLKPAMSDTDLIPDRPNRAFLRQLLAERNQFPDRITAIDQAIRKAFERRAAVLALDMCGFSRITARQGVMHYLSMIAQMEEAAQPAIEANGGRIMKQEADDLFALFNHPADALEAALDIFRAFDAINSVVPPPRDIQGSIGIGFGDLLVIDDRDAFGAEMNFACKLGEDLAAPREILLTAAAQSALPRDKYLFRRTESHVGGMMLEAYRFESKLFNDDEDDRHF